MQCYMEIYSSKIEIFMAFKYLLYYLTFQSILLLIFGNICELYRGEIKHDENKLQRLSDFRKIAKREIWTPTKSGYIAPARILSQNDI